MPCRRRDSGPGADRRRLCTGDPFFCQRHLYQAVIGAPGDCLFLVKGRQPPLKRDVHCLFDPSAGMGLPLPFVDERDAHARLGTGRPQEVRHLITSINLADYSDCRRLAQMLRLEHEWPEHGIEKHQAHSGITSHATDIGETAILLERTQAHLTIENILHRVKDVTFGEDASLIYNGARPLLIALILDIVIGTL